MQDQLPLALTDAHMKLILQTATKVSVPHRAEFLRRAAQALGGGKIPQKGKQSYDYETA